MDEFFIDDSAATEIRGILAQSGYLHPVAKIYERAEPGTLFDDLKSDIARGVKSQEELATAGKRKFDEVGDSLRSYLAIGVHERSAFRPEDLCAIGNVTFAMSETLATLLRGYRLTFEDGRFLFRAPDGAPHTLRSIARSI